MSRAPSCSGAQCPVVATAALCVAAPYVPACPLVAAIVEGHKPSYATVLKRSDSSSAVGSSPGVGASPPAVLGLPEVRLPLSQLTLGRTTAPWHASAWLTKACDIRGDALRVEYPRGSGAFHTGGPPGGCSFKARPRCLPATDLTFSYKVWFPGSFKWSKGGKLPGIFVGTGDAAGGHHSPNGASVRVMWREDGRLVAYVYTPTGVKQPAAFARAAKPTGDGYGVDLFTEANLFATREQWTEIIVRVKLNSFGSDREPRPDGALTLSVNGVPATLPSMIWRRKPGIRIDHLAIVTFYGGKWKCPAATHTEFKDFACVS
jgi:hypothetical protein